MLPLAGIKVIDMAKIFFGPGASMYLADQGAEVIKVEPLEGDGMRSRVSAPHLEDKGLATSFLSLNRNKRSIAVDVRTQEGQEIVHRLVAWADVLVLNFRVGDAARVRLDYDTLREINPRLIYASITAFGETGPDCRLPGYDMVIQARSGVMGANRDSNGTPKTAPAMIGDMSGCMALSYGIMVALWERHRTGAGQRVDTSLLDCALAMQLERLVWVDGEAGLLASGPPNALYAPYRCSDGAWIAIVLPEDYQWKALCKVLGLEHLAVDPEFDTFRKRTNRAVDIGELLQGVFETRPSREWLVELRAAGIASSEVRERKDLSSDPQLAANGMLWEQQHPIAGRLQMIAPPVRFSNTRTEPRLRRPAPLLGQHTTEILAEFGYTKETCSSLFERGVVR